MTITNMRAMASAVVAALALTGFAATPASALPHREGASAPTAVPGSAAPMTGVAPADVVHEGNFDPSSGTPAYRRPSDGGSVYAEPGLRDRQDRDRFQDGRS
jgi:hypothetical protein